MSKSGLDLLKDISEIVGIDVQVFFASRTLSTQAARPTESCSYSPLALRRLIMAFQSLPSQETRERAILFLEALAGEAHLSRENAL